VALPGLGDGGVEGVLQNLFGDELPLHHEAVEQLGIRNLIGGQVDISVVDLDVGPVFMRVADEPLELKLESQSIEFLNLLCQLRELLIERKLVANADCSSLGVNAAFNFVLFELLCYKLKGAHKILGYALVEAVLEILQCLGLLAWVDKIPDQADEVLSQFFPA